MTLFSHSWYGDDNTGEFLMIIWGFSLDKTQKNSSTQPFSMRSYSRSFSSAMVSSSDPFLFLPRFRFPGFPAFTGFSLASAIVLSMERWRSQIAAGKKPVPCCCHRLFLEIQLNGMHCQHWKESMSGTPCTASSLIAPHWSRHDGYKILPHLHETKLIICRPEEETWRKVFFGRLTL